MSPKIPDSDSVRPPLACRLARLWSALTGQPGRHASTCPSCREHAAAMDDLDLQLRRTAPLHAQPAPDDLADRIFRVARPELPERPRRTSTTTRWVVGSLAGLTAAAAAVVAIVVIQRAQRLPDANPFDPATAQQIVRTLSNASDRWRATVLRPTAALEQPNPLQTELDAVYSDTRSALRFLAVNFLPEVPERLDTPRVNQSS